MSLLRERDDDRGGRRGRSPAARYDEPAPDGTPRGYADGGPDGYADGTPQALRRQQPGRLRRWQPGRLRRGCWPPLGQQPQVAQAATRDGAGSEPTVTGKLPAYPSAEERGYGTAEPS